MPEEPNIFFSLSENNCFNLHFMGHQTWKKSSDNDTAALTQMKFENMGTSLLA